MFVSSLDFFKVVFLILWLWQGDVGNDVCSEYILLSLVINRFIEIG